MEEYLAAADLVASSGYGKLSLWETYRRTLDAGGEVDEEQLRSLESSGLGDLKKGTVLGARRRAVAGLSRVRALVLAGNLKPVHSLHPTTDHTTLFPELSRLRSVVRFLATEAYVAFADGNSASGTEALLAALSMTNRLPQDTMIARLVSMAGNSVVLSEFEQQLGRLSAKDVAKVASALSQIEKWQAGLLEALAGDVRLLTGSMKLMREAGPDDFEVWGLAEGTEEFLKGLRPADLIAFFSDVEDRISNRARDVREIIAGPEVHWFSELKAQGFSPGDEVPPATNSIGEAARQFAHVLSDTWLWIAESEARYRTQLRLLRLHMRILAYKWAEGRLPDKLEQVASKLEIVDAFGGDEFQYRPDRFGSYELFSKGVRSFGRIDLRWRKDPTAPRVPGDDDPPARQL